MTRKLNYKFYYKIRKRVLNVVYYTFYSHYKGMDTNLNTGYSQFYNTQLLLGDISNIPTYNAMVDTNYRVLLNDILNAKI